MTCIVGLEHNGKTLIGGDLQGTGWNNKIHHTQSKVFSKKGVLFGYTTSYRFGQIIEHNLTDPVIPEDDADIYRWLITVIVPDVREILTKHGFGGHNPDVGGNALIGVKGQLWELQPDYSVLRSVKGFTAVGSGYEYAIGSLSTSLDYSTVGLTKAEAELVIKRAIEVAGRFCPTVGQESTVLST